MRRPPRTALVLGGGGLTGIGWESGIIHGLARQGIDLATADVVVGTSAGSIVGALILSHPAEEVYKRQIEPPPMDLGAAHYRPRMMAPLVIPALVPGTSRSKRKRIGAAAMRAHGSDGEVRTAVIRSRIGVDRWPDGGLLVTAVDAQTGRFVVFDRDSGVDLPDALAASCAVPLVWPAVTIDGTPYMDGGMRSTTNADVAREATDVVVVLAPLPWALSRRTRIASQIARCRAARHVVVVPDRQAWGAFGSNVLDASRRPDAAYEGLRQSVDVAERVRAAWNLSS